MKTKIEHLKHSRIKATITLVPADMTQAAEDAYTNLSKHIAIKGFRPGKAPKQMNVASIGDGRLLGAILDDVLPMYLEQVINEEKCVIIDSPTYDVTKAPELDDEGLPTSELEFTAEVDILPEVTVADYSKIKVKAEKAKEVTDKSIEEILGQLAESRSHFAPVDRAAKKDDRVEVDFVGKRNGLIEERLGSKRHPIIIGSNVMIPGFEDQLIGHKADDKFSFEIEFPKDYRSTDLAGQKAVFEITVYEVAEKHLPELDDKFAEQFGHKTLTVLKTAIGEEQKKDFEAEAKLETENKTVDEFIKLVKVDVPNSLVEREIDRQVSDMKKQIEAYGMKFADYLTHLKKSEEEIRTQMRPNAEKAVKIGLGLGEVVKREKIKQGESAGSEALAKLVEIATK